MSKDDLIFELRRQLSRQPDNRARRSNTAFELWFEDRRSGVEDALIDYIDDAEVAEVFAALRKEQRNE